LSEVDIRIKQLAVTLTRDYGWYRGCNHKEVKEALLYIGLPIQFVQENYSGHFDIEPVSLAYFLRLLQMKDILPAFLTEMLRSAVQLKNVNEFRTHLLPLGLDWDVNERAIRPTSTHPEAEEELRKELEELLSHVDTSFPNLLKGAWETYYSDNPDKYRQAVTSCRELLRQVMEKLGGAGTRKERIGKIMRSESASEVVDAAAELVEAISKIQSKGTHGTIENSTALFAMVETEHILYFLLNQNRNMNG
jgi:hypothetical protein